MEKNGIVMYREKLEQVIDNYHDFLGEEADSLCREHSIPSAKDLQKALRSIVDKNRLLKVGIVGRVKSGKSSLLNALIFNGRSILPKAATPMTAALTTLSYGEIPSAEVEFFTQEDFEDIKDRHDKYNEQLDRRYREILDQEKRRMPQSQRTSQKSPEELAQRKAKLDMDEKLELSAAHEQYTKMNETGLSIGDLGESKLIGFKKLSDLSSQLDDYVGANGRYMPFTKSVNIRLPRENLKDIEIVDTPGINDPVRSREERTREHLNQCDVVLILSPAVPFMTTVDLELMDRIISKVGRELFVVAAKVDDELFGNLKDENNGQLDRLLDSLKRKLGTHLTKVIADLKESNPEVGDTYDQLLQGQSQIILSSGICESLKQLFGQRNEWDEGMQHVWDSLLYDYPDYFSNTDKGLSCISLDKLSNISAIQNIVKEVRTQKQEIIEKNRRKDIRAKRKSLYALRDGLLTYTNNRKTQIESTDITKFKEQSKNLNTALINASEDIKSEYEDSIHTVARFLEQELQRELKRMENEINSDHQEARGEKKKKIKKKGIKNWWARVWSGGGYEEKIYTTCRTNVIFHSLLEFSEGLTAEVVDKVEDKKRDWRNNLNRNMTKILRQHFSDESLEASMIRRVIRDAVHSISIPAFEYKNQIPDSLKPQGVLQKKKAETFLHEAHDYVNDLYRNLKRKIRAYRISLAKRMEQVRLDELLLKQFTKELAALERSITNKEMELKRISNLKGELEKIAEMN